MDASRDVTPHIARRRSNAANRRAVKIAVMSSAGARLNVTPTVTTLAVIKSRLAGAQRGHRLLKKKADALTLRHRAILRDIVRGEARAGDVDAGRALRVDAGEARGGGTRCEHAVLDGVDRASVRVLAREENVAGVKIPKVTCRT